MHYRNPQIQIELTSKYGFTKVRSNYYRCYGEGLLHVIMIPNSHRRLINIHDDDIYWGVFSLYSKLSWISSFSLKSILQYDLHLSLDAKRILGPEIVQSLDEQTDLSDILERTVIYLSQFHTHSQLAKVLEENDLACYSRICMNDSLKISPYVLSGQHEKANACITAIEEQNWLAHEQNKGHPGYDQGKHKRIIENRLEPMIHLRGAIRNHDRDGVAMYLHANYSENTNKLRKLGVPIGKSCYVPRNSFPFPEDT